MTRQFQLWMFLCVSLYLSPSAEALEPIPDKIVVLTFDDASKSHVTVVRPILKQYGFGATFFVTEGFDFVDNKRDYMTWDQIAELHRDGFEIGNHTRDHLTIAESNIAALDEQLRGIEQRCEEHGITRPTSFAYPGNGIQRAALPILKQHGIEFARRGGAPEYAYKEGQGVAYEPGLDHPLLIPSAGDARPGWTQADFQQARAVQQARHGRIAVLQFHGVPDTAHDWVNTTEDSFRGYMKYLAIQGYRVIALRDLKRYVDPEIVPSDPWGVIEDRKRRIGDGKSCYEFRQPMTDDDTRRWLVIMLTHGYSLTEIGAATGWDAEQVTASLNRFHPVAATIPSGANQSPLILPYPGGRHPRRGFLDGAIRPQRETKLSAFAPWPQGGYAVVDVPEAIWVQNMNQRELLYLAHTHVPTMWSKQGMELDRAEWSEDGGRLSMRRRLPNDVEFGTNAKAIEGGVHMTMWLRNGTNETLNGLVVQNCVMLKECHGFDNTKPERVRIQHPWVACRNSDGNRWIITGWEPCVRPWANPPCPCIHSDPQFPDCEPGQTQRIQGWISFYEGSDIDSELKSVAERFKRAAANE